MNYTSVSASDVDLFDTSYNNAIAYFDSRKGKDPLIDFAAVAFPMLEKHREAIEKAVARCAPRKSRAGRPALDPVFMMKVLMLQRVTGLSDAAAGERFFCDLKMRYVLKTGSCRDRLISRQAIWKYREIFAKSGLLDGLFDLMTAEITEKLAKLDPEDLIIDSTFNVCPRQRNTKEENEAIKAGKGEDLWENQKHRKSHKDTDARWAKKRNETFFGYKIHVKCTAISQIITAHFTTAANVHGSQVIAQLLREEDKDVAVFCDAGYTGKEQENLIIEHGLAPKICMKGTRGHPLTDEQKARNRGLSKIRCLIEHVFGWLEQTAGGLVCRTVGMARAKANSAITCLVYNLARYSQILKHHPDWL